MMLSSRPNLTSFSPSERRVLVETLLNWINDHVVADHLHCRCHTGDKKFVTWHREFIAKAERFLSSKGQGKFVPLPYWNPTERIPDEFNVVKAEDNGTPRPPLENLGPIE